MPGKKVKEGEGALITGLQGSEEYPSAHQSDSPRTAPYKQAIRLNFYKEHKTFNTHTDTKKYYNNNDWHSFACVSHKIVQAQCESLESIV